MRFMLDLVGGGGNLLFDGTAIRFDVKLEGSASASVAEIWQLRVCQGHRFLRSLEVTDRISTLRGSWADGQT